MAQVTHRKLVKGAQDLSPREAWAFKRWQRTGNGGLAARARFADSQPIMTTLENPELVRQSRGVSTKLCRIFHPCDLSKGDQGAFLHALRIAVAVKAQLEILHVRNGYEPVVWSDFPSLTEPLERWGFLREGAKEEDLAELDVDVVKAQFSGANAFSRIAGFAAAHRPNLSVLATHQRRGWERFLHGSIAEPIARTTKAPALFIPRDGKGFVNAETGEVSLKNVLVPLEAGETAHAAFEAAALLPTALRDVDTHFTFLHIGDETKMPDPHENLRWAWTAERRAWRGNIVEHIRDTARATDADLIVMTTGGHHGITDAVLGSITERVVREATCPVLAVPHGFSCPCGCR